MRSLQIIFLILAIHLRGSSADLPGWLKKALESTKNGFATAWNATRTAVEKAWNATKSGTKKLWRSVKNGPSELFDSVKRKVNETMAAVREYAEDDWDCGADKFWLSKLYAKLLTNAVCLELIEQINDACIEHDQCYAEGKKGRITCDLELAGIWDWISHAWMMFAKGVARFTRTKVRFFSDASETVLTNILNILRQSNHNTGWIFCDDLDDAVFQNGNGKTSIFAVHLNRSVPK